MYVKCRPLTIFIFLIIFSAFTLYSSSSIEADLSTFSDDSDFDIAEEEIISHQKDVTSQQFEKRMFAVLDKPELYRLLLPWLLRLDPTQTESYKNGERHTGYNLENLAKCRLISRQFYTNLSLPIEPQNNNELDTQIIPPQKHMPHSALNCFDNENIRQRFESFLQSPLPDLLLALACAPKSSQKLFDFFLSYFDMSPLKRAYHLRKGKLIENHQISIDAVYPLTTWNLYHKACLMAALMHHPEAMVIVRNNGTLFPESTCELPLLEIEQLKLAHSSSLITMLSLLHASIVKLVSEEIALEKKGSEKLVTALDNFEQRYKAISTPTFLALSLNKQTEKCCNYKDAAEELLKACKAVKTPPLKAIKHLTWCIKKLNKITGETLEDFSNVQNDFNLLGKYVELEDEFTRCAKVNRIVESFFTTIPGIPSPETYYQAYIILLRAAETKRDSDRGLSYTLAHGYARKYFYMLADEASPAALLTLYKRFSQGSFSFHNDEERFNELSEVAKYFLKRAQHALQLEVCMAGTLQECVALANDYHVKADELDQDNPAIKEIYLLASVGFVEKIGILQNSFSFKDSLWLCRLYFELAKNTSDREKKEQWFAQALQIATKMVQQLWTPSSDYSLDKTAPASLRFKAATYYKLLAGLNYFVFLYRESSSLGSEYSHLKYLETYIFDVTGNKLYVDYEGPDKIPDNATRVISHERRVRAVIDAAQNCIKMIDLLGAETPHDMYLLALRVLSAALTVVRKEDALYEELLAYQMFYLQKKMAPIEGRAFPKEARHTAYLYHAIGLVTQDQHRKGTAYAQALSYYLKTLHQDSDLDFNEYLTHIDTLLTWTHELNRAAFCPTRSKPPLYVTIADFAFKALAVCPKHLASDQVCKVLYPKLRAASDDKVFTPVPFGVLSSLTRHLYKAAWLCRHTKLFVPYLTRAVFSLESLLHNLPEDVWPTSVHASFLGISFQTLAHSIASVNREESELYKKKSRHYFDEANKIASAQKKAWNATVECLDLQDFVDKESPQFENSVQDIALEFEERLKSLCTDDESSASTGKYPEVSKQELEHIERYLDLSPVASDTFKLDSPFERAFEIQDDLEAQENHLRSFLQYALALPSDERLYVRQGGTLKLQGSRKGTKNQQHDWNQALAHIMPLIILAHPQACTLMTVMLNSLKAQDPTQTYTVLEALQPYLRVSLHLFGDACIRVIFALMQGDHSAAVQILVEHLGDNDSKIRYEKELNIPRPQRSSTDDAIRLSRETAVNTIRLADDSATTDLERIQNLNSSGLFYEKALNFVASHEDFQLPQSKDFLDAYASYKRARECRGITSEAKKKVTHDAARMTGMLVDYLGDLASEEECLRAFNESMSEIQALEDYLAVVSTKKEYEKMLATKSQIFDALKRAECYYTAALRRNTRKPLEAARNFVAQAHALEKSTTSNTKSGSKRSLVQQACLLYLAGTYYKTWLDKLENTYDEMQITEAIKCYQLGYQRALSAELHVLEAHFVTMVLTMAGRLHEDHLETCQAHVNLLSKSQIFFDRIAPDGPDSAYNKTITSYHKALSLQDPQAKFDELAKVEKYCIDLLKICENAVQGNNVQKIVTKEGTAEPLFDLTIKGEETTRKFSWIETTLATIFLETAKHAPTCEASVSILNNALHHLKIKVPEELEEYRDKLYTWREIAKALIRKKVQNVNESASRSSSISSTITLVPPIMIRSSIASLSDPDLRLSPKRRPQSQNFSEEGMTSPKRNSSSTSNTSPRKGSASASASSSNLLAEHEGLKSPRRSNVMSHAHDQAQFRISPMRISSIPLTKSVGGTSDIEVTRELRNPLKKVSNALKKTSKN